MSPSGLLWRCIWADLIGWLSTLCTSVSVSGQWEAECLCRLKRLYLPATSAQVIASDCELECLECPPPPSPVGEAPYIQSFRRFMWGNNSHEAPSLLLARMLSSFARWGLARPLGNPSWTTPPGMPPSSHGNSPSCCASNRGSSGLCGRWVPPSAPSAPMESVNTIMG